MGQADAAFTGSIPEIYDRCMGATMFAPYGLDLARRLRTLREGRLLELAAGTGIATAALAAALPESVQIVATDLNQPMLDYAESKHALGRVRWQQADALSLPFDPDTFVAVVCQFGVMFFADRVAGLRQAHRVLVPGGRLVFSVWDRLSANPLMGAVVAGLAARHPSHPSWFLERTPCGYHDPEQIRADVSAAGFVDVSIETVALSGRVEAARDLATGLCQGSPMRGEIEAVEPGGLQAATEAAAAEVARRFGPGPFEAPLQALVVEARRG